MDQKIIYVNGEEAALVTAAQEVERAARQRALDNCPPGMKEPFIVFDTELERNIMDRYYELQNKYRQSFEAPADLMLIPRNLVIPAPPGQPQIAELCRPYKPVEKELTEQDIAKIFLERVMIIRLGGTIFFYTGQFFKQLDDEMLRSLLLMHVGRELNGKGTSRQLDGVAHLVQIDPTIYVPERSNPVPLICMRNGVLNPATMELTGFSPSHLLTHQLQIDWNYTTSCPKFDAFLYQTCGGEMGLINLFWEALGFLFTPDGNRAKKFVLFQGYGDTGKSLIAKLVKSYYDKSSIGSVDIFRMKQKFSPAVLVGKAINMSMDLPDTALSPESTAIIKMITGGDEIQVEEKYHNPYAASIDCKLLFGTNTQIRLSGVDPAFTRRILCLPFRYPVPPERQDPFLLEKLLPERAAILYRSLAAYQQVIARGYQFSDFNYSFATMEQPADRVVDVLDGVQSFVADCCEKAPEGFIPTEILFERYLAYCHDQRLESIPDKQQFSAKTRPILTSSLQAALKKQRYEGTSCNGYAGIRLKS